MKKPKKPLNQQALKKADDEFYANHPELVKNGKRQPLDANDPAQATLRTEWLQLYLKYGGEVIEDNTGMNKVGSTVESCTKSCPPCPKYDDRIDTSMEPSTYNCAGLAHRTYTFIGSVDEVKNKLAVGKKLENGSKLCQACRVKHWLWELEKWRVEFRDLKGRVCHSIPMPAGDFHTVAGRTDNQGNDPKSIYSKNGKRPLEGPKPPLQWQLKTGDECTENSPESRPLYFSVTDREITQFDNYFKQQGEEMGFAKSDLYSDLKQGADLRTSQISSENLKDVKADSYYLKGVINIEEEKLSCYCLECK